MDRQPGTRNYYVTGGMTDGGNLYRAIPSGTVLIGATGWSSVPGLAFTPDGALWGSAAVSIIGDGLISIDLGTGAGTLVGGGYGGPGGIDAIAWRAADSTMYANTGFFYDSTRSIWTASAAGADGNDVRLGGAANRLPDPTVRNLYTNNTGNDLTTASNAITPSNASSFTNADFGLPPLPISW